MKLPRAERLVALTHLLLEHPLRTMPLSTLTHPFDAARSTASEDVAIVKRAFDKLKIGRVETISGAAGGVRLVPSVWPDDQARLVEDLCRELSDPRRLLPGGFMYMRDILFSPARIAPVGRAFAARFRDLGADCVMTVETKGIPLAFMTASRLGVPLVVCRREGQGRERPEEGPVVTINYVSGTTHRLQTMSLARRSLAPGSRVLIVDDFMKGGGSAKGMSDLVREFEGECAGIGVLVETSEPAEKMVAGYASLLAVEFSEDAPAIAVVRPGRW